MSEAWLISERVRCLSALGGERGSKEEKGSEALEVDG